MRIARTRLLIAASAVASLATAGAAVAAPGGNSNSNWHVGYYNNSGRALSEAQAASTPNGPQLTFTSDDNTALLTTSQGSQKGNRLGDLTGKTITARFNIAGTDGFTYYGEPDGCNTPANTRLFFSTSNAGGFDFTHYWWSNPNAQVLVDGNNLSVTATVDPANWSDYDGKFGTDPVTGNGFDKAAANVTEIGLSFGGGCFFENGVGSNSGAGTLTLTDFTVA
jgi:hypothetical protein